LTAIGTDEAGVQPRACLAHGVLQHVAVSLLIRPVVSAIGMNSLGGMRPLDRVVPAHQRLDAHQVARFKATFGW
jgi:hypothetical protein